MSTMHVALGCALLETNSKLLLKRFPSKPKEIRIFGFQLLLHLFLTVTTYHINIPLIASTSILFLYPLIPSITLHLFI